MHVVVVTLFKILFSTAVNCHCWELGNIYLSKSYDRLYIKDLGPDEIRKLEKLVKEKKERRTHIVHRAQAERRVINV